MSQPQHGEGPMADWKRRLTDIANHPGRIAFARWDQVDRANNIYHRNQAELQMLLHGAETVPELALRIMEDTGPETQNEYKVEYLHQLDQRFHNMVAGAGTLIDVSRRIFADYEGTEFYRQWNERNSEVGSSPVGSFIKRFRAYLLHVANPPYRLTLGIGPEWRFEILLPTDALLNLFSGWNVAAKQYMQEAGEAVRISTAVNEYAVLMDELYTWAFHQFEVLHGDQQRAANDLARAHNGNIGRAFR